MSGNFDIFKHKKKSILNSDIERHTLLILLLLENFNIPRFSGKKVFFSF